MMMMTVACKVENWIKGEKDFDYCARCGPQLSPASPQVELKICCGNPEGHGFHAALLQRQLLLGLRDGGSLRVEQRVSTRYLWTGSRIRTNTDDLSHGGHDDRIHPYFHWSCNLSGSDVR